MSVTTYTNCLRIERTDGFVICLTELDKDLIINDQLLEPTWTNTNQTYISAAGYTPTNMQSTSDNAVNNADVEGVLSAIGVNREDIIGGRYDFAKLHIFIYDYVNGIVVKKLGAGHWGEATIKDGSYVAEFRSLSQQLQQTIGRTYNPECDEQLGGTRCTINLLPITSTFSVSNVLSNKIIVNNDLADILVQGSVTTATSNTIFSDSSISQVDNYYDNYYIKFTSGNNIGIEAQILTQIGTVITLTEALPNSTTVGDSYNIYKNVSLNVIPLIVTEISQSLPTSVTSNSRFQDTLLTAADGTYDSMIVKFTTGANIGEESVISSYTIGDITLSTAMPNTITVTDLYDIYYIDSSNVSIGTNGYEYGKLLFTSGLNINLHMEIKKSTVNSFELFLPMPFTINIGDSFNVYYGCNKHLSTCKDKYNNHINHQGFPYIPGIDQVSKFGGQ